MRLIVQKNQYGRLKTLTFDNIRRVCWNTLSCGLNYEDNDRRKGFVSVKYLNGDDWSVEHD